MLTPEERVEREQELCRAIETAFGEIDRRKSIHVFAAAHSVEAAARHGLRAMFYLQQLWTKMTPEQQAASGLLLEVDGTLAYLE